MTVSRHPVSRVDMGTSGDQPSRPALMLGFWAALATATTYIVFEVGLLLDPVMDFALGCLDPDRASALIAPASLLLTVSIYVSPTPTRRLSCQPDVAPPTPCVRAWQKGRKV